MESQSKSIDELGKEVAKRRDEFRKRRYKMWKPPEFSEEAMKFVVEVYNKFKEETNDGELSRYLTIAYFQCHGRFEKPEEPDTDGKQE